jgi:hypothetical protein
MRFSAEDTTGQIWQSLLAQAPTTVQVTILNSDPFEVASGWVGGQPGDTATTGNWNRMDPFPTAAQPGDDHSVPGVNCWVTDGNGGTLGQFDIDNGFTTLMSPMLDLTGTPTASIRYWRWYSNNQGSVIDDVFTISISNNNGATWTIVEIVNAASGQASGGWFQHSFEVASLVTPTAQMRMRFVAADIGSGSIVEAAVDDFEIADSSCDGEIVRGGVGCADSSGTVLRIFQTGSATLGSTINMGVEAGVVQPTFLVAGITDTLWGGTPLPFVIPGTGTPGCQASTSAEWSLGMLPLGGTMPVAIPSTPVALGVSLFWQAALLDSALTTSLQIATTDILKTTIGN